MILSLLMMAQVNAGVARTQKSPNFKAALSKKQIAVIPCSKANEKAPGVHVTVDGVCIYCPVGFSIVNGDLKNCHRTSDIEVDSE